MLLFPLQYCIFYIVDVILMLTGPYYSHLGSLKKKTKTQVTKRFGMFTRPWSYVQVDAK